MEFRVHFADGVKIRVEAETADNARRIACETKTDSRVEKIKIVRDLDTVQDVAAGIAMMLFLIGAGFCAVGLA